MARTPYLVDSNILLRWVKPDHNDYPLVVSAIEAILRRDGELCYTSQNVGEFWNTCTRPLDRNGYALSPQETDQRAKRAALAHHLTRTVRATAYSASGRTVSKERIDSSARPLALLWLVPVIPCEI